MNWKNGLKIGLVVLLAAVLAVSQIGCTCAGGPCRAASAPQIDIVDTAAGRYNLNTTVKAIEAAGLVHNLKGCGPFTFFAPSDAAFRKMDKSRLDNLMLCQNQDKLAAMMTYHIVPCRLSANDLLTRTQLTTLSGRILNVRCSGGAIYVNDAKIVEKDISHNNGEIHIIKEVHQP